MATAGYMITIRINEEERKRLDKLCLEYSQKDIFVKGLNACEMIELEKNGKKEV